MSYLIILFVVALALAPILALKPSKQQKHLIKLRDRARQLGLQVQVCEMPQTHRQQVRREDTESGVVYRLLWRHPLAKVRQIQFLLLRPETERNTAPAPVLALLQKYLDSLPDIIAAIEFTNIGVAVYWQEQGDVDVVETINNSLQGLRDQLEELSW